MIGIYERYSSEQQGDGMCLELQENSCRSFIKREGLNGGTKVYPDRDVSGTTFARPEYQRLVEDIKSGLIDTVVVCRYDRLGRNSLEAQLRIDAFEKLGVKCFSATEGNGKLIRNVLLAVAEQESDSIATRTRDGLRALARRGFWCSGKVFGYDLIERDAHTDLRISSEEARIVERVFRMYGSGMGFMRIARVLNREGIPGPRNLATTTFAPFCKTHCTPGRLNTGSGATSVIL